MRLLRARALGQLRQFGAILDGQEQPEAHDLRSNEIIDSLRKAAAAVPIEAWDHLMPCLLRVGLLTHSSNGLLRSGNYSHSLFEARRQLRRLKAVLCRVLKSAGISMIRTDPESFWSRVRALDSKQSTSAAVNWVIAHSIAAGPNAKAGEAVNWLLSDQRRLRCGPKRRNGHFGGGIYRPARRLLRRYGVICSEHHFKAIEDVIRGYRPANELRDFRIRHETFMGKSPLGAHGKGHLYPRLLFLGQYLLLSALPDRRLDVDLRDWRGVLHRKFGGVKALIHEPPRGGGGFVTSTIPKDRLHLIPNRQWLDIVSRDWTPYRDRRRQISANTLARVGPETFAKDLGAMCLRQPQRFTELALQMPVDVDNHYLISMLHALTEAKPPENTPEAPGWQPASCQQIESVFEHFSSRLEERECASGFCRIIHQRPEGSWSRTSLHRLVDLAMHHPHPADGEYTVFRGGATKHPTREADIVSTALNCVRGQAAGAIAEILYCKLDEASFFRDAISALLADKNIAVRAAAIGLAVPMLNGDRAAAVDLFLRACDCPRDDILEIHHVDHFLSYTILDYLDRLLPLLHRMVQSPLDEVATKGAGWITVVWVNTGKLDHLMTTCAIGHVAQRKGVTQTLVNEVIQGRGHDAAAELLGHLFDDADDEVRQLAASGFHSSEILRGQRGIQLANAFANSRAVSDKFDFFFMGLKSTPDSLVPYADAIFSALDRLVPRGAMDLSDLRWRVLGNEQMVEVLLRLYEQSDHDRQLRKRCLDEFDRLLAQQIGSKVIEQLDT